MKKKIYAFALTAAFVVSMPFTSALPAAAAGNEITDSAGAPVPKNYALAVEELRFTSTLADTEDDMSAEEEAEAPEEDDGGIKVYVNGEYCDFDVPAQLIDSTTYVPLRACAEAMGDYEVTWSDGAAHITGDGLAIDVQPNTKYISANGRCIFAATGVRIVQDVLMLPIRTLAAAFSAEVSWDGTVLITTGDAVIESGDSFYDEDDVYWLSRIINAEAKGQPIEGKIAVGNVILNRVAASNYPDTIYDVIFDFSCGVQFTPAYTGSVYNTPSDECIVAAKLVLDGADTAGECLFFASVRNCWAAYNRPYVMTIGGHDFYA